MNEPVNCETCEENLFELQSGELSPELAGQIDKHLQSCDACSALLNDIWQMNLVSTRWRDESVPEWNRTQMQPKRAEWHWPQLVATAASILALVMVITDTHIVTNDDGITLKVGRDGYITQAALTSLQQNQNEVINARFQRLTAQQIASDQLLLRSVLETSRSERREELGTLVTYWNTAQAQQARETREDLQYLLLSQAEDEKDIQQLSAALLDIHPARGEDM